MATRYSLIAVDTVPSTQDVAREAFEDDPSHPILVTAERQEAGRGRTGVGWIHADRAVAASLAFGADETWNQGVLPLVAGMAMRSALADVGVVVQLKWPNDLMDESGAKVGGVLSETDGRVIVIGAGVNLFFAHPPAGMAGIFDTDPGPAMVGDIAAAWADRVLASITSGAPWDRDGYRRASMLLGEAIIWDGGSGTAVDVGPDGALVVGVGTERVELHSGEVRLVRRATLPADDAGTGEVE